MAFTNLRRLRKKFIVAEAVKIYQCNNYSTWNNLVKQAEATVGYSTSFLNLRWLLTDEIANLASNVNKLMGTNHPLLQTAKKILIKSEMPSYGLIVLLMAKASGCNMKIPDLERDTNAGILHTQRMVAEVVEILRTGIFFHKSLLLRREMKEITPEIHQGNKIALLIGDYLITKSYQLLAEINNSDVEEIISLALRDLAEAEFVGDRDEENEPLPSAKYFEDDENSSVDTFSVEPFDHKKYTGKPKAEWMLRNTLESASLLGKGCLSVVKLGGHSRFLQEKSYSFGINLALVCQARQDLVSMKKHSTMHLSRVSAPVLFHLEYDRKFVCGHSDVGQMREVVRTGPGIQKTEEMLEEFREKALLCLNYFPESRAKVNLHEMIINL